MREGHAWGRFAARVQRVQRGWWRLRRRFKKRGAAGAAGCVEGLWKKVLKMDRPLAGGFLSCAALRAEGCGLPFGAQRTHFEGALATRKM